MCNNKNSELSLTHGHGLYAYYRKMANFAFGLEEKFFFSARTFPISRRRFNSTNSSGKGPFYSTNVLIYFSDFSETFPIFFRIVWHLTTFSFCVPHCQWLPNFADNPHHEYEVVPCEAVVRLLEDGLEEERVLGQPLHGPHQDVKKAESVAVLNYCKNLSVMAWFANYLHLLATYLM